MQQIPVQMLDQWLRDPSRSRPVLLDVREDVEFGICHLPGSQHIPMQEITQRTNEIDDEAPTVVICHHGLRSMQVALYLEQLGFTDLYNLQGGIDAWARQIEPSMPRY
ncbi:MAG: rhodanese-like domain-containing protein [Chitinivorax sp.]